MASFVGRDLYGFCSVGVDFCGNMSSCCSNDRVFCWKENSVMRDYSVTPTFFRNSLADSLSSSVNSNGIAMSLHCEVK